MEEMAQIKNEIFKEFERCNKCGLCQSVCPVYKVTKLESYSPRGKVRLTREICNNEIEISKRVKNIFEKCLLCGSCYNICPAQVHGNHLFSGMRWRITERYGVNWKKKLLYRVLNQPWRLKASVQMSKWAKAIFGPVLPNVRLGNMPIDRIPAFNDKSFNSQVKRIIPAVGTTRARVLYFHGCATNYLFEKTGFAVVDVLTQMGVEVHVPSNQGCCGLPIFMSGAREMSLQSIKNTVHDFAKKNFDAIIVDCATCGSTLKKEYSRVLQEMKKESIDISAPLISGAIKIAYKTNDIMEFISKHKDWLPRRSFSGEAMRVTYHDPCHLSKGQGIEKEPRQVLQSLPGVEFIEAQGASDCCGGGGSFQVDYPEISKRITDQKINMSRLSSVTAESSPPITPAMATGL